MKPINTAAFFYLILQTGFTSAQQGFDKPVKTDLVSPRVWVFDPMKVEDDLVTVVETETEMPLPGGMSEKVRKEVDAARHRKLYGVNTRNNYKSPTPKAALDANFEKGIEGSIGSGTPNDNHVAVGNDGKVINVLNTVIRVYNDTGKFLKTWSLVNFIKTPNIKIDPIPNLNRVFDPRVLFDPIADRFIVLFMEGTLDINSKIIVGFSTTNNPLDPWNMYMVPGKPTKDSIWSDYPIVSQNRHDLFFTVNLIGNNASWEEGFTEAVIWQLNKADGYKGDSLHKTVFTGIKHNGKALRSICAIQNGWMPDGDDNYFVSVKPIDKVNDTLFMLRVTNTQSSGKAKLELSLMKTDIPYGFPPSALQPDTAYKLRTNDVRVLTGMRVGNTIQYLQNCINFNSMQAHLAHGTIYNIYDKPFVRARMITDDSLDLGYPAIASAGNTAGDPSCVITFVYSSPWHYPGFGMLYQNRYGEYSKIKKLKTGQSLIYYNYIPKGEQRWGDYEGIQSKYNEKNVFYMVGSYGKGLNMNAYVARVKIRDSVWENPVADVRVFPVPVSDHLTIELRVTNEGVYSAELYNSLGQKLREQKLYDLDAGTHLLQINHVADVAPGIYTLKILGPDGKSIHSQQILTQ